MRSHPYTPPPPLPPVVDQLYSYLPNQDPPHRLSDDTDIPLAQLDPETSRLIPQRKKLHRVRVQGQLVVVKSVSVANLRSAADLHAQRTGNRSTGATPSRRRRPRSLDEDSDVEDGPQASDGQLRGYGIGGAGNIRRPTDVMGGASSKGSSLASLFSSSSSTSTSSTAQEPRTDRKRWNIGGFVARLGDRKGKGKATS